MVRAVATSDAGTDALGFGDCATFGGIFTEAVAVTGTGEGAGTNFAVTTRGLAGEDCGVVDLLGEGFVEAIATSGLAAGALTSGALTTGADGEALTGSALATCT